jgi:hypothetical protein
MKATQEIVMKIMEAGSFFQEYPHKMFYVGFMKARDTWFPLCSVSDPKTASKFDSLYVSLDYMGIHELVEDIAGQAKGIEGTFVHYLLRDEVENIMDTYSLNHVVLARDEEAAEGCSCGCGCGHGFAGEGGLAH